MLSSLLLQEPFLYLDTWVTLIIRIVAIPVGVYAFVHSLLQRKDAYTAVSKQTKPIWGGITGVAAVLLVLTGGPLSFLWLIGLIATLVYLVDVRPRLLEIQQGRW